MNILYTRVSTIDQKTDRQRVNANDFQIVIEDKCSGSIPFFERTGGKEILTYINKEIKLNLYVWTIDRLGRDLRDILNTIYFCSQRNIPITFISQGLKTIDDNGKENPIAKLIISILGTVGELERVRLRESQREGVRLAVLKGDVYLGRKTGTKEDVLNFLEKPKNKKALEYIRKGYKLTEAAKLSGVHINTVTKIKKLGLINK